MMKIPTLEKTNVGYGCFLGMFFVYDLDFGGENSVKDLSGEVLRKYT